MTDNASTKAAPEREAAWAETYRAYTTACTALQVENAFAVHTRADINREVEEHHNLAAIALLETPAANIVHVAQKLRAADNLLNLSQLYPGLADLLLADIFALIGIDSGDQRPLPYPLH